MIDEGTLRERFPEIPWDQPARLFLGSQMTPWSGWACRYCVALVGIKGQLVLTGTRADVFDSREQALDHIEREHHD